jgi:hypothetical protein
MSRRDEEIIMAYRVYSGPPGSETVPALERDRWLYKECTTMDEALTWARHVSKSGRVPLLIEGDDGTKLTKQQIANTLVHSESELAGAKGH